MLDTIARNYANRNAAADVITGVVIGDTHNPYGYKNVYVVSVNFMHGDGDSYETEECGFLLGDEERMLEFLNFLSRCSVRDTSRHRDSYNDIEGYSRWIEDEDIDEWDEEGEERSEIEMDALRDDQILRWPFWEGEWSADFNGAHVVFFDENGVQKTVKMSTEA